MEEIENMEKARIVAALSALAQPSRLDVFRLLVRCGSAGLAAGEIAERTGILHTTLSFHLSQLAHAGLIVAHRRGRSIVYTSNFAAMQRVVEFLSANCCFEGPCLPLVRPVVRKAGG